MLVTITAPVAVLATVWEVASYRAPDGERVSALAGLIGAVAYSTELLLILGTRGGAALERLLAPPGRMALTNYLTATLIVAAVGPLPDLVDPNPQPTAVCLGGGIGGDVVDGPADRANLDHLHGFRPCAADQRRDINAGLVS